MTTSFHDLRSCRVCAHVAAAHVRIGSKCETAVSVSSPGGPGLRPAADTVIATAGRRGIGSRVGLSDVVRARASAQRARLHA